MSQILNPSGNSSGSGIETINGDVGSVTGSVVTLTGGTSGAVFTGAGTTMTESFNFLAMPAAPTSTNGYISIGGLKYLNFRNGNTLIGQAPGNDIDATAISNRFVGNSIAEFLTTGDQNIALGTSIYVTLTTGSRNIGIGNSIANDATDFTGSNNIFLGNNIFSLGSEENCIYIGAISASGGENSVIRLGDNGLHTNCYIGGINGVTVSNAVPVTIDSTTGQLGVGTAGQTQSSAIASGSAVSLTTATPANVTSISLTAGTWSISALVQFGGTPTVTGAQQGSISTTSATHGTLGNNSAQAGWLTANFASSNVPVSVPGYILTVGSTTTVYLVASGTFGAGSMTAYGRISAIKLT